MTAKYINICEVIIDDWTAAFSGGSHSTDGVIVDSVVVIVDSDVAVVAPDI